MRAEVTLEWGAELEELGRLGAHQRGYLWWRSSVERETAAGGQTRGRRRRLSACKAAWNRWRAQGGDGGPARGQRRPIDIEVPATARRRNLTSGVLHPNTPPVSRNREYSS
jgi:hypothetical protein